MRKEFELDSHFPTGEPTFLLVAGLNGRGQRFIEKNAFDRAASSPALEYIRNVQPEQGNLIILVNAMGAFEAYDDNRNGDAFPNRPVNPGRDVTCKHAGCQGPAWVTESQVLSKHYKSFKKAHFFEHHKNKDPKTAFGDVIEAFWNDRMQRVELLLRLYKEKNPKLARRIEEGEYPAVSMGCRVKYDVCHVCGHRAPTRAQYCVHARERLRQVLEDGTKVCVHNPDPDFFDISAVWRPADQQGFMLMKVAEHALWEGWSAKVGEELDRWDEKIAEAKKIADIRKAILGQVVKAKSPVTEAAKAYRRTAVSEALSSEMKSEKEIAELAKMPIGKVAAYLASQDRALSVSDITRLFYKQAGLHPTAYELDAAVAVQPALEALYERDPSLREKVAGLMDLPALHQSLQKEASLYAMLMSRSSPSGLGAAFHASAPPKTDVFTMTDMNTGHQYQTTRGAAQAADWQNKRHALLGSVLLSSAYGMGMHGLGLTKKVPWWITMPVAGALGTATYRAGKEMARPFRNPEYMTDQGIVVPGNTEFTKVSELQPSVSTLFTKIAADYYERTGSCDDPQAVLFQKVISERPTDKIAVFFSLSPEDQAELLYKAASVFSEESACYEVDVARLENTLAAILCS